MVLDRWTYGQTDERKDEGALLECTHQQISLLHRTHVEAVLGVHTGLRDKEMGYDTSSWAQPGLCRSRRRYSVDNVGTSVLSTLT